MRDFEDFTILKSVFLHALSHVISIVGRLLKCQVGREKIKKPTDSQEGGLAPSLGADSTHMLN